MLDLERKHLSRQEKRRQKLGVAVGQKEQEWPQPEITLDIDIPTNIGELQVQDKTLEPWFQKATGGEKETPGTGSFLEEERYILKNQMLYQMKGGIETLVLPGPMRQKVMTLAHSIPWSGHLGRYKTLARVGSRFSWPNMYTDVSEFVRTCSECQLTSGRAVPRAHLHPLPIIHTPFARIGMDIVGPLERSKGGYQYILVVCDYATRYPEAFPLRNIKARQVANCLVQLFSRVGVPREIVTDQGTNFLSLLLRQVYSLLGIKGIKTTPYHPQTDGLVERFNLTSKTMLRRFVSQTGKDWDEWLPYLLFAYREVPQAFREQMETQLFVRAVIEVEEPEEQFFPVKTTSQTVDLSHLEEGKQHQVKKLLDPSLFQERPGRATAVEHDIILRPDTSPQRKSYRVPEKLVAVLRDELDVTRAFL